MGVGNFSEEAFDMLFSQCTSVLRALWDMRGFLKVWLFCILLILFSYGIVFTSYLWRSRAGSMTCRVVKRFPIFVGMYLHSIKRNVMR